RDGRIVAVLAVLELAAVALAFEHEPKSKVLRAPPSPAVQWLEAQHARFTALPFRTARPLTTMLYDLSDLRIFAPLPLRRLVEYTNLITPGTSEWTEVIAETPRAPLLDRAAVKYLVVPAGGDEEKQAARAGLEAAYRDPRVAIF